ncbi:MAG: helix-turn-helix domain-containing protein [Anaerolineae bacterium]
MDDDAAAPAASQPAEQLTITSLETLKVFSDPLRQHIIEALFDGYKTVKQIASELELPPTKLYYHINLLEEHGLIRVVDTRIVSGIIEKQYGIAARNFTISRSLLTPGQKEGQTGGFDAAMQATIERTQDEIRKGVQSGTIDISQDAPPHRKVLIGRGRNHMSKAHAEAFYARLIDLMAEFEALHDEAMGEDDDPQAFALIFALYPLAKYKDNPTNSPSEKGSSPT